MWWVAWGRLVLRCCSRRCVRACRCRDRLHMPCTITIMARFPLPNTASQQASQRAQQAWIAHLCLLLPRLAAPPSGQAAPTLPHLPKLLDRTSCCRWWRKYGSLCAGERVVGVSRGAAVFEVCGERGVTAFELVWVSVRLCAPRRPPWGPSHLLKKQTLLGQNGSPAADIAKGWAAHETSVASLAVVVGRRVGDCVGAGSCVLASNVQKRTVFLRFPFQSVHSRNTMFTHFTKMCGATPRRNQPCMGSSESFHDCLLS